MPLLSRSEVGQVNIEISDRDTAYYRLDGGQEQIYTKPIDFHSGGTLEVRSKATTPLIQRHSFDRMASAALRVVSTSREDIHYGTPATHMIDSDSATFWHTAEAVTVAKYPHWVDFDTQTVNTLTGFEYLACQGHPNGRVKFTKQQYSRYVRFTALSSMNGGDATAVSEFDVLID